MTNTTVIRGRDYPLPFGKVRSDNNMTAVLTKEKIETPEEAKARRNAEYMAKLVILRNTTTER